MSELKSQDHLSHAYILAGPKGEERQKQAVELAQRFVCDQAPSPCGYCEDCRKVAQGIHPDVITIQNGDKPIGVGEVRAMGTDAYILPNQAHRKVYLLPDADLMGAPAQNAMLKLLEDGPRYAAFLLLTQQEGNLLPTVRSRCEILRLVGCQGEEPDPELLKQADILAHHLLNGAELPLLTHCVTLEKWDREKLGHLFEFTIQALHRDMGQGQVKLRLKEIALLKELKQALQGNVGAGHVVGCLCAQSF